MKKIKVIDLLNKIANGEEVPTKFTYKSFLWEYDIRSKMWFTYYQKDGETLNHRLDRLFFLNLCLNEEVEIIEDETTEDEPKSNKIEKLKGYAYSIKDDNGDEVRYFWRDEESILKDKINEIIDKVNDFKEE